MIRRREEGDVALAEFDDLLQVRAEDGKFGFRPRLDPGLLRHRGHLGELHHPLRRDAGGDIVIAADHLDQASIVRIRIERRRMGLEFFQQLSHRG